MYVEMKGLSGLKIKIRWIEGVDVNGKTKGFP